MATGKINRPYSPENQDLIFGNWNNAPGTNMSNYWKSGVPNDDRLHFVELDCSYGAYFGFVERYSTNYGVCIVFRHDDHVAAYWMNNSSGGGKWLYGS